MEIGKLYPLSPSQLLIFCGTSVKGKNKGKIICGEGLLRKGNKVYIYGRDTQNENIQRDAWHLVDLYDIWLEVDEIKVSKNGRIK